MIKLRQIPDIEYEKCLDKRHYKRQSDKYHYVLGSLMSRQKLKKDKSSRNPFVPLSANFLQKVINTRQYDRVMKNLIDSRCIERSDYYQVGKCYCMSSNKVDFRDNKVSYIINT